MYVPDQPGCVAAGASVTAVKAALAEMNPLHLDSLRERVESVAESVVVEV